MSTSQWVALGLLIFTIVILLPLMFFSMRQSRKIMDQRVADLKQHREFLLKQHEGLVRIERMLGNLRQTVEDSSHGEPHDT